MWCKEGEGKDGACFIREPGWSLMGLEPMEKEGGRREGAEEEGGGKEGGGREKEGRAERDRSCDISWDCRG